MGLSRLDNFLKSVRGTILYVNPNDLDATDSIENQGNSLTRPFKTIQRALIESARFSYQKGLNNDRFNKTTILLYPGDHLVDNRPGWIPDGSNNFVLRDGGTSGDFPPFDLTTNFDLTTTDNALYKLNSVHGGVIIPRGTSIVGLDLRKTKIRPKYVPDPTNDNIERATIFRVTGGCYFWQFSLFDADPNGQCFIDYTSNLFVPNFSHHKLSCFEYADGVNDVKINDAFISNRNFGRTDLEMYYEKVGLAYGQASGRAIEPDYPSSTLDIQPKIDEYRIVGSTGFTVGISSIRAGDGITATNIITVTTVSEVPGLDVDTPFRISGVTDAGYDGQYVVTEKVSDTQIRYQVQNAPSVASPIFTGSNLILSSDTVTSASPYIFNISLRSVYGMCGLLADGAKATGFKSMVVAQFTGIGLQKDDNAFVIYDETTGTYLDNTVPANKTISTNSRAVFKPTYKNFHIKCTNDAFIQNVSVFAIGYAEHFVTESGGDMSITNSNSNFGAKALISSGFRTNAFPQDDVGYITHIIPPKEISNRETSIEFASIDVAATVGVGTTSERLYLYNQTNAEVAPEATIEGYRVGARENDNLNLLISVGGGVTEYSSRIVMPNSQTSSEKKFFVSRSSAGINSIGSYSVGGSANVLTLTSAHTFENGETVRIISDNGRIPDGLIQNRVYYAITNANPSSGITTNINIKLASTLNDARNANAITINENGGVLSVVSRVSDKIPGDIGHPIQYDNIQGQWYIRVATASTENAIHPIVVGLGTTTLGQATSRTYIKRKSDNRNSVDTIYRLRYVIPSSAGITYARPPSDGFIIQESNTSIGSTNGEIQTYFGSGSLNNINQQRNFRFISNAEWITASNVADISTELPHNLSVGSQVEIVNVTSTNNLTGIGNSGFNGTFNVVGITSAKQFRVGLNTNPGTFSNNTNLRTTALPYYKRKRYDDVYYIYRSEEAQKYIAGKQDGVYYLTVINSSNSPTVAPFTGEKYSQPVKELYPQTNRDNPIADPEETKSFASPALIGEVHVNDVRNSITKETVNKVLVDNNVGSGVANIITNPTTGVAYTHTVYTSIDHGLNRVISVGIANSGAGYGSGTAGSLYNARLVGFAGSTTGQHATAKLTVNSSGNITDIKIMDGGSAYGIGNTLAVVGVGTTTGFQQAVVTVTKVFDNVGDTVRISGVKSDSYRGYNDLYRISSIAVGAASSFIAVSANSVANYTTSGISSSLTSEAFVYLTGKSVGINTITYDYVSGIATITTQGNHGFQVNNKIKLTGADQSVYNGDFVVTKIVSKTSFAANLGISTSAPTATGTIYAYPEGVTSNDGVITQEVENINGRMVPIYAGITTTLLFDISNPTTDQINLTNVNNLDITIGDYLQINDEVVRVKTTVSSGIGSTDAIYVFRGALGTKASYHDLGTTVKKISVTPVELRRHSIIRASGHTFEYVGFGPGNYSTAFPDKQNRQISAQEELLAQSTRREGGINFYTGMNDKGISYSGNKKLSTITGQEEIFDTPVQTITGEDIGTEPSLNIINPVEGNFSRSIRVEGGSNGRTVSEFNGPVVFNNKLTSNSSQGIEANSVYIQGDATVSRKYTVGISTPTAAGNPGDVVYTAIPTRSGYLGWVYTSNNTWEKFGKIGEGGQIPQSTIGVSTFGTFVGFSTLINFVGSGITITSQHDSQSGITTLNLFGSSPQGNVIGVSTTIYNTYVGLATQINFVGYGVTISSAWNTNAGIATLYFDATGGGIGTLPLGSTGSFQYNNSGYFGGVPIFNYNSTSNFVRVGSQSIVGSSVIFNSSGSVGFGSTSPSAKIEVLTAAAQRSLYIKSTSGSGEIVRIENSLNPALVKPFIIDINGNVGINIQTSMISGIALDVAGNAAITGEARLYDVARTNYGGFKVSSISSNYVLTLPSTSGSANQLLYTTGSGNLEWISPSSLTLNTDNVSEGSTNKYFTSERAQDAIGDAINAGIQTGIVVTYDDVNNRINFQNTAPSPYPFTTRGFNIPF